MTRLLMTLLFYVRCKKMADLRIQVKAKPWSKERLVTDLGGGSYVVKTTFGATDGKANEDVVGLLAEHFGVAKSQVVIVRGSTSSEKVVMVSK